MRIGDLIGSGTISGDAKGIEGCLFAQTEAGEVPIILADGEKRTFLEYGDTVRFRGWAGKDGAMVGFGECVGMIMPTLSIEPLSDTETDGVMPSTSAEPFLDTEADRIMPAPSTEPVLDNEADRIMTSPSTEPEPLSALEVNRTVSTRPLKDLPTTGTTQSVKCPLRKSGSECGRKFFGVSDIVSRFA